MQTCLFLIFTVKPRMVYLYAFLSFCCSFPITFILFLLLICQPFFRLSSTFTFTFIFTFVFFSTIPCRIKIRYHSMKPNFCFRRIVSIYYKTKRSSQLIAFPSTPDMRAVLIFGEILFVLLFFFFSSESTINPAAKQPITVH